MMKADVLSGFDTIKVCTHYKDADGQLTEEMGYEQDKESITPVYKDLEGWSESLEETTDFEQLPRQLHEYIKFVEDAVGVPINIVSVGPDRKQTIIKEELVVS